MKKVLIVLAVSILVIFSTNLHPKSFGLKLGVNFTNFVQNIPGVSVSVLDEPSIVKKDLGFSFGVFYTFDISAKFQIQPEIYYIRTKTDFDWNPDFLSIFGTSEGELGDLKIHQKLDVIRLPILLKYKISILQVFAGPYISYLLKGRQILSQAIEFFALEPYEIDILNEGYNIYNRFNYGVVCGLEFEKGSFIAGIRYSFDLTDNTKDIEDYKYQTKHYSISILLGWRF
jgi:hypothetical protein